MPVKAEEGDAVFARSRGLPLVDLGEIVSDVADLGLLRSKPQGAALTETASPGQLT